MNFVGIVGTNASFSYNRKLLWFMKKHFKGQAEIDIQEIVDVPLFSEDCVEIPLRVREIARAIEMSDGVIFSTPEYDHSITAGLKSLIEWLSWGELHPLTNTPVMIVGTSLGKMGTVFAQENLRTILQSPGIDAFVLPSNQFLLGPAAANFDDNDALKDARTIGFLESCFANFEDYVVATQALRAKAVNRTGNAGKKAVVKTDAVSQTAVANVVPVGDVAAAPLRPSQSAVLLDDGGDGWWIEKVSLFDATVSNAGQAVSVNVQVPEIDAATGASQH